MRKTSADAYHEIKENGTLAKLEAKVLEYIKFAGPISGRLINKHIPGGWKRCSMLEAMGCIEVAYEISDPVTKHTVTYWMFRSDTPTKPRPSKAKDNDPLKLHALYDTAFRAGAKAALDTVFPQANIELKQEMIDAVVERVQG